MKQFSYENLGANTYLVYTVSPEDVMDSMSLGMLTHNHIRGLAAASFSQMDTQKYIKYNVSAKVAVKQLFSGTVNRKRLLGVFSGIVEAMLSAEEYMIEETSMVLDLEYIFTDVSNYNTAMICLPLENRAETKSLSTFFKEIMFNTQFDQTENCDHVAQIINYLNGTAFSVAAFKDLLDKLREVKKKTVAQPAIPQKTVQEAQVKVVMTPKPEGGMQTQVQTQPVSPQPVKPVAPQKTEPASYIIPGSPDDTVGKKSGAQESSDEKQISMFYLLQHYNKENAAAYKAQKEAKKGGKAKPVKEKQEKKEKEKKKGKRQEKQTPVTSYTVPGAPQQNVGFAVPGQQPVNAISIPKAPTPAPNQAPVIKPPVQPEFKTPANTPVPGSVPVQTPVQQAVQNTGPQKMNFGDTTILGSTSVIGETTVLNLAVSVQRKPFLVRLKNNEKIPLDKPVFRIGKERSYVDYFISDNPAISRSHANIVTREEEYYVVDTNSTNHTYVNGAMIPSNEEYPLEDGAKVRFANEDFEFKIF